MRGRVRGQLPRTILGRRSTGTGDVEEIPFGEFVQSIGATFLQLIDTPASYTGQGKNFLRVNVAEDAVEFHQLVTGDVQFSASDRILARDSSGAGAGEEITASAVLDMIGTTRGSILYRGASGWAILAPGTSTHVLTSNGAGADPSYQATAPGYTDEQAQDAVGSILIDSGTIDFTYDAGAPSITAVVKDDSITYAKIQNISATSRILGRKTSGAGDTEECTLSEILDFIGSAAQGDILYRGASAWARLAAGTNGHYLQTQGAGANPQWAAVAASGGAPNSICEFRFTYESGVPISASDQTAKTTLYCTPYKGNKIGLYDGSSTWAVLSSSEFNISLSGLTANTIYDVFCYNNSGVPTLELTAWSNSGAGTSARATALALQDGILVKSGATTRRYLGTLRIVATGQGEDSERRRFLWNYYNRVTRRMQVHYTGGNHEYHTSTIRQFNADATLQLETVIGVSEDMFKVDGLCGLCSTASTSPEYLVFAIGFNATNAYATNSLFGRLYVDSTHLLPTQCQFELMAPLGYNFYAMLQKGAGGASNNFWYGNATGDVETGLYGTFTG